MPFAKRGPPPVNSLAKAREYTVSVRMRTQALHSQRYIARCLEFPDLLAFAGSEYRALNLMREAIRGSLLSLAEQGRPAPTPSPEDEYTGT